jgi:hypothetical protein
MSRRPFILAKDVDHDEPSQEMLPRSDGTRIVLFPSATDTGPEYAIGMEPQNMWFNTSGPATGYKFYFGSVQRYLFDQNNITLPAAPTANMHAATKQYVDNAVSSGPWTQLSLLGGATGQNLRARWINNPTTGSIQIRGQIYWYTNQGNNTLATLANLPAGLRPSLDTKVICYFTHSGGAGWGALNVLANGNIQLGAGGAVNATIIVWLDGIVLPLGPL